MKPSEAEKNYYLAHADFFGWGPQNYSLSAARAKILSHYVIGEKILDVGCGSGATVDWLSRNGFKAVGVDFVPEFIHQATKQKQGKFIVAKAEKLPFSANSFDTVIMFNLLEHLDKEANALKEAKRVGKRLIIGVPLLTPKAIEKRGLVYRHYLDHSHRRTYTYPKLKKILRGAKLKIIKAIKTEKLPTENVVLALGKKGGLMAKTLTKLLFLFLGKRNYFLEMMVVAEK